MATHSSFYQKSYSRKTETNFTLKIFNKDRKEINRLVLEVPNGETGGNLFGLWTNCGDAVVFVATGPGQNCRRTGASFYQDIPYMSRVGDSLTKHYPLCHIGEWHSHHQLYLRQPSQGDCDTVRRNYPQGSQGFVLMIANIVGPGKVELSPYKFVDDVSPFHCGHIEDLSIENPFYQVEKIQTLINEGKEEKYIRRQRDSCRTSAFPKLQPSSERRNRCRTVEVSHQSNKDVIHSTRTNQWYNTNRQLIADVLVFINSISDENIEPRLSRDAHTENMSVQFYHHKQLWSIDFPPNFPRGQVQVNQRGRRIDSVQFSSTKDFETAQEEIYKAIINSCKHCSTKNI